MDKIITVLDPRSSERILDVGAGTGVLIPLIHERVGVAPRVVALDFAFNMLRRSQATQMGSCQYILADVHSLPFVGHLFDKAICFQSFPHLADQAAALEEIWRCLRRGGRAVVAHACSRRAVNRLHRQIGGVVADHLLPGKHKMHSLFRNSGFGDISIIDERRLYLAMGVKQ